MAPPPLASREAVREERLGDVWSNDLNDVFADVAPYYDRANNIAAWGSSATSCAASCNSST
jgi:demethylmenaquinone methyltransferase/2-methoxy-6-polyprenyl-1,4-benzoquinol methylase